jgi:hypothetical protein
MRGIFTGVLLLTPSMVRRVTQDKRSTRKPGLLQPRCEFKFDPSVGRLTLYSDTWKRSATSENIVLGIHQGGLRLPDYCCQCLKPAERYFVVELTILGRPSKY